jgi:hypothetical protein
MHEILGAEVRFLSGGNDSLHEGYDDMCCKVR